MKRNENIRNMTFAALCTALCPVMPLLAGLIPNGRQLLSPMHIPPLLCGLVTGPVYGAAAGLLGPLLGALTVGTPPMAKLPQMMTELCCYGLFTGLMMKLVRSGKLRTDLWISMVTAMVIGRIAGGLVTGLIMLKGEYSLQLWAGAYFAGTAPGIVLHLIMIPAVYYALERAGLIPRRY
ncbi:MAG: ECF transporter S component [Stomatobaculum sp.]|nr:ECF transporter S component [Stomatobaculum sp.]